MAYDITEHRHRFAAWAAARGAQRGFTSVDNLRNALEVSGIREFVAAMPTIDPNIYRREHRKWCRAIIGHLEGAGVQEPTFGRAAKLVSIYIKTMIVIGPTGNCDLASIAYPPIDSILLKKISKAKEVNSPFKAAWRKAAWSKLDEGGYYALVDQLRAVLPPGEPFWMLEQHWNATDEDD